MFNFGILHVIKDKKSWIFSFRCPCNQCIWLPNPESFTWRYPWKPIIKD